jgi:hypothetical protein
MILIYIKGVFLCLAPDSTPLIDLKKEGKLS